MAVVFVALQIPSHGLVPMGETKFTTAEQESRSVFRLRFVPHEIIGEPEHVGNEMGGEAKIKSTKNN